jgi:hypothetical protein
VAAYFLFAIAFSGAGCGLVYHSHRIGNPDDLFAHQRDFQPGACRTTEKKEPSERTAKGQVTLNLYQFLLRGQDFAQYILFSGLAKPPPI